MFHTVQGQLRDGTMAAVKVLSADSRQGVREFLTEIDVIADIEHKNLVKLHGCCVEGNHRILVYGYLENNSLARTLLGNYLLSFLCLINCQIINLIPANFRWTRQQYTIQLGNKI